MWWNLKKIQEDARYIIYGYGFESYDVSGRIRIDKQTERITFEKLADGDTEDKSKRFATHVWATCFTENAPEERMIAIG